MSAGSHAASLSGLRVDADALERLSPEDRDAVTAQLAELEQAFKENPLLGYRPHPKQTVFHQPEPDGSWPPLRAFFGGNRSGKTEGATNDRLIQQLDRDAVPEHLQKFKRWDPPVYGRVVTPDLTSTMDGVVHEKIRRYCPKTQLKGNSFDRAFDKVQRVLHFKNGSWIQFNSSEQDREKLGGVALHWVYYDEEPRQQVRNECLTRLIDFDGEEIFALTPFTGMAWLFNELYDPWERGDLRPEDGRVVVVDMDDNPYLSEKGKQRALSQYSEHERKARKSGRFVSFSGLIYPEWSEDRYIVPELSELPGGVEVFCGIDPGFRHMCAVLYCYLDPDDDLVVFDEIARSQTIISEVCKEIKLRNMRWGVKPYWYVIDPAARNKNGQTGRSDQQEFADAGIFTIPGQNDVPAGINRVHERLAADKLHVAANCQNLIAEFKRYRYVKETDRGENAAPEKPVKKDDHSLDALRYVTMARPLAPTENKPQPTDTMKDRILRHHLRKLGKRRPLPDNGFGPGQYA